MNLSEQLHRAILIAMEAHEGQLDTHNGRPYIEHPFRVMTAGHTLQEKIVGILHDVVEDTSITLHQLSEEGFTQEILDGVDAMTRRDNVYRRTAGKSHCREGEAERSDRQHGYPPLERGTIP